MSFFSFNTLKCVLTLLLPVPNWAGDYTDLPSDSNTSITVRVNIAFLEPFLKNIQ